MWCQGFQAYEKATVYLVCQLLCSVWTEWIDRPYVCSVGMGLEYGLLWVMHNWSNHHTSLLLVHGINWTELHYTTLHLSWMWASKQMWCYGFKAYEKATVYLVWQLLCSVWIEGIARPYVCSVGMGLDYGLLWVNHRWYNHHTSLLLVHGINWTELNYTFANFC